VLNDGQRRRLATTLQMAEERLLELQRRLVGESPRPRLLDIEDDLSDAERAFVAAKITEVLRLTAATSERLELHRRWQSLRRAIIGTLSISWAGLQEAKAKALQAYGDTDPRLEDILDPLIDRIADEMTDICEALAHGDRPAD
jgi:hypothetical protein